MDRRKRGRVVRTGELGALVALLASGRVNYRNGAPIAADGGLVWSLL